jgi:Domain of unknown function (DUF4386)
MTTQMLAGLLLVVLPVAYNLFFTLLARATADPAASPATREAVDVVFQTLNRYLGVAVGEHLGYLFTGLWTALAGVALIQSDLLPRCSASPGWSWRRCSCSARWSSWGRRSPAAGSWPAPSSPWSTSAGRPGCSS